MGDLRFDGRVAIITGAGRGLGKAYAELLADRGAAVVVNDPGTDLQGRGLDRSLADATVEGIRKRGGVAVANYDAVGSEASATNIVETAVTAFGHVDILINNAGNFLPIRSFAETSRASFENVLNIHVLGAMELIRAVWPIMTDRRYGKILNISSHVGYIGTRGRIEYGLAKGAIHGFSRCLSHEAPDHGICVNVLAPGALTRPVVAETDNFPEEVAAAFSVDLIPPTMAWLVHEDCHVNGESFGVMAGTTTRIVIAETRGIGSDAPTPEFIRDGFAQVRGEDDLTRSPLNFPVEGEQHGMEMVARFGHRA